MLLWFVIIYWIISVGDRPVGRAAGQEPADYAVAGRSLPLYIVTATVFATWFGSETVLGIPATFLREGLGGVIADPFGSSLCLILVGLFFARPLYRMQLLTIGDFYRNKYGRTVEALTTLCIVLSYLGWVAAQISGAGAGLPRRVRRRDVAGDGHDRRRVDRAHLHDVGRHVGGRDHRLHPDDHHRGRHALYRLGREPARRRRRRGRRPRVDAGKLSPSPGPSLTGILGFTAAGITMMLGSIPQQDVFQRVASSKGRKHRRAASILGGCLYFCFAFIPMFLAYSATLIDPQLVQKLIDGDKQSQLICPT